MTDAFPAAAAGDDDIDGENMLDGDDDIDGEGALFGMTAPSGTTSSMPKEIVTVDEAKYRMRHLAKNVIWDACSRLVEERAGASRHKDRLRLMLKLVDGNSAGAHDGADSSSTNLLLYLFLRRAHDQCRTAEKLVEKRQRAV